MMEEKVVWEQGYSYELWVQKLVNLCYILEDSYALSNCSVENV